LCLACIWIPEAGKFNPKYGFAPSFPISATTVPVAAELNLMKPGARFDEGSKLNKIEVINALNNKSISLFRNDAFFNLNMNFIFDILTK